MPLNKFAYTYSDEALMIHFLRFKILSRSGSPIRQAMKTIAFDSPVKTPFKTPPRSRSAPPRNRTSLSPASSSLEVTRLVRHQPFRTELNKRIGPERDRLLNMANVTGAIYKEGIRQAVGGGCLVDGNIVVTDHHCVGLGNTFNVAFTDYSQKDDRVYVYEARPLSPQKFEEVAQRINLGLGQHSDIHLLEIIDKSTSDFPNTCAIISDPSDSEATPQSLTHLGFKGGELHVSISSSRTVDPSEMVKRDLPIKGNRLSWSGNKTHGIANEEELDEGIRRLTVSSKAQTHHINVDVEGSEKKFKTRTSKIDLKVEMPILEGDDHAIVGNKTGEASSGGTYWDEARPFPQSFYGLHCGKIPHALLAADPDSHFENHLVLRLGSSPTTPFILDFLEELESKPTCLKDFKPKDVESFQNFLGLEVKGPQERSLGYIQAIRFGKMGNGIVLELIDEEGNPKGRLVKQYSPLKCLLQNIPDLPEANVSDIWIGPKVFTNPRFETKVKIDLTENKATMVLLKPDDGHCILGVASSAIAFVPQEYKDMIQRFEKAIDSRAYHVGTLTNGKTNTPILPDVESLHDVIGHTGLSSSHKNASGSDVKIYLGPKERIVYQCKDRQLYYDADFSASASH